MSFQLDNEQRKYFGLEPIENNWEKIILKGDSYRPETVLFYENETIKRHIVSTEIEYKETQYNELTRDRTILLPKTAKGKEKKLTASVLEARQPTGVYCTINSHNRVFIGNYNSQTTFYDSRWEKDEKRESDKTVEQVVKEFIVSAPPQYLFDIELFKNLKRKNTKFKAGDFFAFKISRHEYGFGRILLDVDFLKNKSLIHKDHGLNLIMAKPVLVKLYAFLSQSIKVNIKDLENLPSLPSDYMMDNLLLYGQFEIIGNKKLETHDLDFPMSYGRYLDIDNRQVFLQWGLINKTLPLTSYNQHLIGDNPFVEENSYSRKVSNPYGYYSVGFYPNHFNVNGIRQIIKNDGILDFDSNRYYKSNFDLRNPQNKDVRFELMNTFGLDPNKSYQENCKLIKTPDIMDFL